MERTETYCDFCRKQMSYQHVDGDTGVHGIQMKSPFVVDLEQRTSYGSSSSRGYASNGDFCSSECFTNHIHEALLVVSKFGQ